jgi:hypothetical protein
MHDVNENPALGVWLSDYDRNEPEKEPAGSCIDFFSAMATRSYLETSPKIRFWAVTP